MTRGATCVLTILLAVPALAHDTWLLPASWQLAQGERLVFHLTSAMAFPEPETPVKAERLTQRRMRLAGKTHDLDPEPAGKALELSVVPKDPGLAVAAVVSRPREIALKPDEVKHYLEEVGAADTIGARWAKSGQATWRETYVKVAKTLVRVGTAGDRDGSWAEPLGLPFELVPEGDPTALTAGDSLALRLLWEGKPLPDLAVAVAGAAPAKPTLLRSDSDGRVAFTFDRPGPWLIRATYIRPSESRKGEWESTFTTLTVNVKPR